MRKSLVMLGGRGGGARTPLRCTCTHFFIVIISILRPEPGLLKLLLSTSIFFISATTIETLSGGQGRGLSLIFSFAYSQKIQPRKASLYFFSPYKLAQLFLLKKVLKFSHERLDTNLSPFPLKLVVEWWRLSRFPAKMTLAHARALLKNLVLEVFLFLESKAKVSIISQVPNHSPPLGSFSIYDGDGSANVTQKENSRCFKPLGIYSISLSNVGEFFCCWILNDCK